MGRNSSGNRGGNRGISVKGFNFSEVDVNEVAKGLKQYAKVDRWNKNTAYSLGFNDDAQGVIDDVAKMNVGFASDVAKTVQKYNYTISDKQAFVIASAAVKNKSNALLTRRSGTDELRTIFKKVEVRTKPKTVRQLQKAAATAHMPKKENIVSAMKRRGVNSSKAWKIVNNNYSSIAQQTAGGGTKDVIELFMSKV